MIGVWGFVFSDDSSSKDRSSPAAVVRVSRGLHSVADRVDVCSKELETAQTFLAEAGTAQTMNCSEGIENCGGNSELVGYHCSCKSTSLTYVASLRKCVKNSWLRKGCAFRFGSWRHQSGWTWNDANDKLLTLFLDVGYGITGAFNASKTEYEAGCSLINITLLNTLGSWEGFVYNPRDIRMFMLRNQYYISWATDQMNSKSKQKLRGRLLRFVISCQATDVQADIVKEPFSSCLTFKVTGNFTSEHEEKETSSEKKTSSNTVAIAVGVTVPLLVIIGLVLAFAIYRARKSGTNITPKFITNFTTRKF